MHTCLLLENREETGGWGWWVIECHVVRSDVCDSKVEIVQPYWASNSNGKIRAILNNDQFEQAIHQELCRYRQYFWSLFFEFQSS